MIHYSKLKYISLTVSFLAIIVLLCYTYLVRGGFAHSLDFNGGLRVVAKFDPNTNKTSIQKYFQSLGIEVVVISIDKEKNILQVDVGLEAVSKIDELTKTVALSKEATNIDKFISLIKTEFKLDKSAILSGDQVGAIVGSELTSTGFTLLGLTLLIILIYTTIRFQFKYALGASIALVHDLLITIAFIGAFQIKPSVPIIAALLTLLGYSINDTIVIFDRIRENSHGKLKESFSYIIDVSINQTLGRTINTSMATLVSLVAIIVGGAVELYDFAYVLIFGVIIGTYSSIFIAAPIAELYDRIRGRSLV